MKEISRRNFLKGMTAGAISFASMNALGGSIALASEAETEGAVAASSAAVVAVNEAMGSSSYTPGTYTAVATGMGDVTMTATFSESSITEIVLDVSNETEGIGQAAADELIQQCLGAQSSEIDGVSGATVTSSAVKDCLAQCIAQATGAAEGEAEGEGAGAGGPGGGPGGMGGAAAVVAPFVSSVTEDGRVKGYAGPGDWLGTAPTLTPDEVVDVEVVIVGAGHAGAQAALSVMQNGAASAVILEKQNADIFDWYGEDIAAYNSKLALEHGIQEHDLGAIVNEYVTRSGGRCNPDIIRSFVQNSGPMIDNMLDVAKEVLADKETYASLDGIAGTVLETNVRALEEIMLVYDNTPEGQLFVQTQMDADKIKSGADVYECENLDKYPIVTGTKTWASTVTFAGQYNAEPIQGVAANSTIRYVQSASIAKAVSLGAQMVFDASAEVLVQNEDGDVTGVIAQVGDKVIQYNASKGVILAGGDYAANADMCWALLTEYMEESERLGGDKESFYSFMGGRDGSSVKMGCWAGGFVDPAPRGTMILGGGVSSPWGTNSCLWLNAKGKRYCNEGNIMSANRATLLQQEGIAVMLVDGNWVDSVCGCGLEHSGPDFGRPQFWADMAEGMNSEPDENGQISILTGTIMERGNATMYKADTLDELLTLCGYDDDVKATALASIEHYNEMCHNGADTDYGKGAVAMNPIETAPFFATVGNISHSAPTPSMVTMSGLMTDENYNVMRNDNSLIKGLYAVGNSLGGRYGLGYSCPSAGNSIGMATTNGYVAGKIVAEL
jgi:uncharacterized protein with FMN-binding domain